MAIQDIKSGEIHQLSLLLLMDFQYYQAYLLLILFVFLYFYVRDYIGDGDLLIFILLTTRYGLVIVFQIMLISSIITLIYMKYQRTTQVRYIPFILMGYLINLIMI